MLYSLILLIYRTISGFKYIALPASLPSGLNELKK